VASVVLGVLDEVGRRSGQCLLCGGEQSRLIRLDRHDVVGVLGGDEVFGGGPLGVQRILWGRAGYADLPLGGAVGGAVSVQQVGIVTGCRGRS
jgi:hypothetical protein